MADQRITETIEFLTQVHTSWNETEQRMALREHPRRSISYRYTGMSNTTSEYLRALCNGQQTQQLEFPLWQAARLLPYDRWASQAHIQLSTSDVWDYRDCHAFLLADNYDGNQINSSRFELRGITSNGFLEMGKTFTTDWKKERTLVVPVFWAILNQEDSYTNVTASTADLCINVEVMPSISAVKLPTACDEYNYPRLTFDEAKNAENEYDYVELFMMPPSWYQDENISYSRNANRLDNNTGYFRYDLKSTATTTARAIDFHCKTKEEIHFLQRFFYRCKGQWKSFYMPTWTSDVVLARDAQQGDQVLYGKFFYYYRYYGSNSRRKLIIVFYYDGTIDIIKLVGWSVDNDSRTSKIYLERGLKKTLRRKDIRMISFLCRVRHNSDSMRTEYETRQAASISFEVKEVDS